MPPVRVNIRIKHTFDGTLPLDLRSRGINIIYIPEHIISEQADTLFHHMLERDILKQHTYQNRFKVQITPHRLTYAHVPTRKNYRLVGKDLKDRPDPWFTEQFESLCSSLPEGVTIRPDAAVCNGYRYNNDDYIATHIDDEKFLLRDNCTYWSDPTVCTLTLLRDPLRPMSYEVANPDTPGEGVSIKVRHGSLLIQGSVLHYVPKITGNGEVGRISITMRKLHDTCIHSDCSKITCPYNEGPSNYVYYSLCQPQRQQNNEEVLSISHPKIKGKLRVPPIVKDQT